MVEIRVMARVYYSRAGRVVVDNALYVERVER